MLVRGSGDWAPLGIRPVQLRGDLGALHPDRALIAARGSPRKPGTFPGALLVGASGLFVVEIVAPDARGTAQLPVT